MSKTFITLALSAFLTLQASALGFCFAPYNPDGKGILYLNSGPYKPEITAIDNKQLKALWFYNITLTAEQAPVYVNQLGISVEAHNQIPKTTAAMLMSKNNTENIWLHVQYLKLNQPPITLASDLNSPTLPRFEASQFRIIPQGELSSQKNLFVAEFKNINIIVRPDEKVILSFFGNFNPLAPSRTKIIGHNLIQLWSYSGMDMKFNEPIKPSEYVVR